MDAHEIARANADREADLRFLERGWSTLDPERHRAAMQVRLTAMSRQRLAETLHEAEIRRLEALS
jgi:hypothetical protein